MAVWATIHENYSDINDWKANGSQNEAVETAMKALYAKGQATTSIPQTNISVQPSPTKAGDDEKDDTMLSQVFTISSATGIGTYTVSLGSSAPSGAKVTDLENIPKTTFSGDEKFKVLIPKTYTERQGTFDVIINTQLEDKAILYGLSHDDGWQNYYVVPSNSATKELKATATFDERDGETVTPPPSETPPPTVTPPGSLKIVKIKAGTTQGLAGAEFRVTNATGGVIGHYYTNASGIITIPNLASGAYYIDELQPPAGYVLDKNNHKDVVLRPDEEAVVTFSNEEIATLEVTKVDADTNEKLSGAVFRVAYDGGHDSFDIISDASGTARLTNLKSGTYTVTEISAPSGYILDSTPHPIKLEPGKKATITLTNRKKPGILIKKYDEGTGMPLEFAEFSIAKKGGAIVYEGITDKSGTIKVEELAEGWYTITEIAPPPGYLMVTESKDVYLEPNSCVEVKFDNRLRPSLQIMKIDSQTGKPLAGAKFSVKKTEDLTVSEYITDASGTILIHDLDEAIYTVTEVKAPDGYLLEPQHSDIKLEWGKTKTLVFENKAKPSLEILKIDEASKEPLAGAKFRVTRTEGNTTSEYVTDASGRILIEGLEDEIYSISEIVAPDGYLLEEQHKDVQLEWGVRKTVVFTNKKRPVLEIKKIDSITGEPLANARFKVTKTEDKTVSEYITNATGIITIKNLDEAIYTVEEIVAPDGWILDPQHKEVALEWGKTKTLVYENTKKPTLVITKTNGLTYKPIPDTTYKIEFEGANGGIVPLGTYRTDKNGQIIIPKVNAGWYIITEIRPAPGFQLSSNPVTRKYLAPGENSYTSLGSDYSSVGTTQEAESFVVTSGNDYILGEEVINFPLNSIVIKKVDANTSEMLAGAVFEVRKVSEDISGNSGTIIGRWNTDNSGIIVITGLDAGAYIVEEVAPPTNYLLSENSRQQAWLKPDGTSIVEVTFTNYPYGSLLVTKVDAQTGKPLANARFKVTDGSGAAAGNTNGVYTTDENGEFLVPNLKPDSYVVTELEAPENYVIDTTPQTVQIGTDGKTYKLSFKNQPIATIVILKLDEFSREPLANAEFKVTTSKGNVVGTGNGIFKTDANGTITIPNLEKGSYIVEEIKAPSGYLLENQSKTIEVDYGKTYTLEFYNKRLASVVIQKLDSHTRQPLSGAIFQISRKSGDVVGNYTTNGNGIIQIDELPPGWYSAVEVKAPNGYLLNDNSQDFEVTTTKTVSLTFENNPKSSLVIKKYDAKNHEPLSGARFQVKKKSGDILGEYTTNSDGIIQIDNMDSGWYTAVEVKAPNGYLLNDVAQDFEITHTKTVTLEFPNEMLTSLIIKKVNDKTGEPLSGAKFSVELQDGRHIGDYSTDKDGLINIPTLAPGWYIVREKQAPDGFLLDETPKTIEVKTDVPTMVTFTNKKLTALEIIKIDEESGAPLAGAKFTVEKQNGERIGEYTTDNAGIISIPTLAPDWYVVKEIMAPVGYLLDEAPKTVEVKTNAPTVVTFTNKKLTALQIKKTDDKSGEPLGGAKFAVEKQDGQRIGEYTTDRAGIINIPTLAPDWYVVKEIMAPDGYLLDESPKTVEVKTNIPTVVTFTNKKLTALEIKKIDDKSGEPFGGAKFAVEKQNGERVGEYTTDRAGIISIPTLAPDWYVVKEIKAPDGYLLDESPKTVEVKTNAPTVVTFVNKQLTALEIKKVDEKSGAPLAGAKFAVEKQDGQRIGEYTTDVSGIITIPTLDPDWYVVKEIKAPDGYLLDESPKTVEVKTNAPTVVTFVNKRLAALQIKKIDEITGAPLAGAVFKVTKQNGEVIGEAYVTDKDGFIQIPALDPGYYAISEMKAPAGYILDNAPKTVEVKTNIPASVTFSNKPLSGLKIIKLDSVTREPLKDVEFAVAKMNGERIGNFKTDSIGQIYIANLEDGYYTVTEIKGIDGYLMDKEPKTVQIQWGKPTILEVTNDPFPTLLIKKTSAEDKKPLADAKFLVTKLNGEQIGTYTTDRGGLIVIQGLEEGKYLVRETEAPQGFLLDETAHEVDIIFGKRATLEIENKAMASILIQKIDSVTKKGIYGVKFLLYDEKDNPLGQFISDDQGYVWLNKELPAGKYKLRELEPANGYLRDDIPRTIYLGEGQTTHIVWENTPQKGQILITKRSSSFNEVTGLPAGSLLAGAVFEVYNTAGNVVDKMVSDSKGIAASKPLPIGMYFIKEVSAPRYYGLNSKELWAEIKHNGDIVRFEVFNESINLNLTIQKKGPNQAAPGQTIRYDLYEIANNSSVALENFYIHDRIPSDATRAKTLVTGTYSERMYYKVTFKTNQRDYRVLAENLLTKNSYEFSLHPNALGLAAGEYVTDIRLEFPKASPGFKSIENMVLFCEVMPTIPKDYNIVNRADLGGRYGNEWESAKTSWNTKVWTQNAPAVPLPRTGY